MTLYEKINSLSEKFLYKIAENYKIKFEDDTKTCMYLFKKGNNAGKYCTSKPTENGYCGKHQCKESAIIDSINGDSNISPKKTTKTTKAEIDIINWFNTAIPSKTVHLKKCSKGLINEDTEFIFTRVERNNNKTDYIVIGKKNGEKISKLNTADIEICENNGWKFDTTCIEDETECSDED
jgi:hypothetical protein